MAVPNPECDGREVTRVVHARSPTHTHSHIHANEFPREGKGALRMTLREEREGGHQEN